MKQEKYMVAFMYPRANGGSFNLDHYINAHLPLGVGLAHKHLDIKPSKIAVYTAIDGKGDNPISKGYAAICNIFFDSKNDADKFLTLFNFPEAAARLSADYPNYTTKPPQAIWATVTELQDMNALIDQFQEKLETS
ncbi:MAG: hypothetical protein NUV80_06015 [Candidatus Berkelbacteria bacterium]|nr:hypothetical protein [Candidatus Berkelbacteria bacterium]